MILQVLRNWGSLQSSQWLEGRSLLELQSQRLRKVVSLAYHEVPFYHQLYKNAGVTPADVRDIKSIRKLPLINKDLLRTVPVEERTAVGTDLTRCRVHTTSGSTGKTLTLLEDPSSASFRDALNLRFLWAYGVRPLDRIVSVRNNPAGSIRPVVRIRDRQGLWGSVTARRVKQLTYTSDLNDHIRLFSKWKPDVLMAQTSYCRTLAKYSEVSGNRISFRIVVTAGEILDDSTRKVISDSFGAEVYDHYGAEEVGGTIAWECPSHGGYHIDAEALLVEFLRKGEPVKAGTAGEVHLTSFCRIATPILRYFNGDMATPVDDECSCGRVLPLIREIQGRRMDFILAPDGRDISPMAVVFAIQYVDGVKQFKVTQLSDFSIEILVATDKEAKPVLADVCSRCKRLFREIPFQVKLVDKIDNPSGSKFHVVESHLPHQATI